MAQTTQKQRKVTLIKTNTIINTFFRILFSFIHGFIVIGEYTKKIILFPITNTKKASTKASSKQILIKSKQQKKHSSTSLFKRISIFLTAFFAIVPKRAQTIKTSLKVKHTTKKRKSLFNKNMRKFAMFLFKHIIRVFVSLFESIVNILKITFGFFGGVIKAICIFLFVIFIKKPYQFVAPVFTVKVRFFIFGVIVCGLIFVATQLHQFIVNLPSPKQIGKVNYSLTTHLYDRTGKLLYEIYHDQNRTPVKLNDLPKYVFQSTIAIEDKDFYQHKGVSLVSGILRAAHEIVFKGNLQGGSTLTQQLVKNALLTQERTLDRKIKEIVLALWTEQVYNKNQILQMYLNQVAYGSAAYGIEEASKTYFGKHANELSIAEAALLAGLPQAPSDYSPFVNPEYAISRRNDVLLKMKQQNFITTSEYDAAKATPLENIKPEITIKAPHFVFYEKSELEKQYGIKTVEEGGLNVTTTLDLEVQQAVEKILRQDIDKQRYLNVTNGAVIITKPATGEIIAMIGSVNYFQQPFGAFNVTTAQRQPGSSLKPLLYSLALQKGFNAASIINDSQTTFNIPGAATYTPLNYDNKFHGNVTMRIALANSYNVPAVRTLYNIGIESFVNYMQKLGISTWNDPSRYVLPMALGGVEVKMTDLVTAYGTMANQGYKVPLAGAVKVQNANDDIIAQLNPDKTRVMSDGISYIISDILSDNFARQLTFGPGSQLEIPGYKVAVKTGTTDSKKDNWAIGYTPEYLVAVWIGNNDNSPMNPAIESGATGASSIWHDIMSYMLKNKSAHPNDWYTKPDSVIEKNCFFGRPEYFMQGTETNVSCALPTPTVAYKPPAKQPPQKNPEWWMINKYR